MASETTIYVIGVVVMGLYIVAIPPLAVVRYKHYARLLISTPFFQRWRIGWVLTWVGFELTAIAGVLMFGYISGWTPLQFEQSWLPWILLLIVILSLMIPGLTMTDPAYRFLRHSTKGGASSSEPRSE